MKEVWALIQGGIGNQLFTYTTAYMFAKANQADLVLDLEQYENGYFRSYQLNRLNIRYDRVLKRLPMPVNYMYRYKKYILKDRWIKEDNAYTYQDIYSLNWDKRCYLEGYHCSEKYFRYHEDIHELFKLKSSEDRKKLLAFTEKVAGKNTVAVHIRRGDYVSGGCALNPDYYHTAIRHMKQLHLECTYVFFSDDIDYVNKQFDFTANDDFVFAKDLYDVQDDLVELFCIAACDHQIIANSTYSWWGAWLNQNEDKTVIAPMLDYLKGKDFYTDSWITLDASMEDNTEGKK